MADATTLEPPRFALFELAYLLAGRADAHANRSREIIGIPEVASPEDVIYQAGLSGLITRGLITTDQEGLIPRNEAGLAGLILGTATQWISLAVRTVDLVDMSLLVQGERGACLVRRAPGPTFDVVFIKAGENIADTSVALAMNLLDADGDKAIMVRVADLTEDSALLLLHSQANGWQLGENPVFPGDEEWPAPDLVAVDTTREGALAALRGLVGDGRSA